MEVIPAQPPSFNLSPRLLILTISLVLLFILTITLLSFRLNFAAFDNGRLYLSPNRLIRVYGRVIDPAQIAKQRRLFDDFENYTNPGKYSSAELQKRAEDTIISRKIVSAETEKRHLTVSQQEINQALRQGSQPNLDLYHWTMDDLKTQVYYMLLTGKLRDNIEGKTVIDEITFWPSIERRSYIQNVANKAKNAFAAGKDFAAVSAEATASAASAGIPSKSRGLEIRSNSTLPDNLDSNALVFFNSLQEKEAKVLTLENQTPMVVIVAFTKKRQEGPVFETWYEDIKRSALSY